MDLLKFVLVIEYDGTLYHGFQWQAELPTIQDELEQALRKIYGRSSRVVAASRTDAGVHAKGQVVSFWAKPTLAVTALVKALNYYLPCDIVVKMACKTSNDFNVRRDAISREYRYYILNSDTRSPFSEKFALFVPKMLDVQAMNKACQFIQGEHDFASFTTVNGMKSTWRNVYEAKVDTLTPLARSRVGGRGLPFIPLPSKERNKERVVIFRMVANSFLPHQVRNTVGLLIRLGLGKISVEDFRDVMEAKRLGLAGPKAPAYGLWLTKVNYSEPICHSEGAK